MRLITAVREGDSPVCSRDKGRRESSPWHVSTGSVSPWQSAPPHEASASDEAPDSLVQPTTQQVPLLLLIIE